MNKVKVTENNLFEFKEIQSVSFIESGRIESNILELTHTEFPAAFAGKGIGSKGVECAS